MRQMLWALAALALGTSAAIANPITTGTFPVIGSNTGPAIIVTVGPGGAISVVTTGQGAYDGVEDTYIGIKNNSGGILRSLTLTVASGGPWSGFDGDGVNSSFYNNGVGFLNNADTSGYAGPNAIFSVLTANSVTLQFGHIGNGAAAGTFVFNGLAPGEWTITSAESGPSALLGVGGLAVADPVPEPATLAVFGGIALAGALGYRRRKATASV